MSNPMYDQPTPLEIPFSTPAPEPEVDATAADREEEEFFKGNQEPTRYDSYERVAMYDAKREESFTLITRSGAATDKQRSFIARLAAERDYAGLDDVNRETITAVLNDRWADKMKASQAITVLLKCRMAERQTDAAATNTARVEEIPAGKYALADEEGIVRFYSIRYGKPGGRWEGYQFINGLLGSPGAYEEIRLSPQTRNEVKLRVAANIQAAAKLYAEKTERCTFCDSPLSDVRSRAAGWGETCAANKGLPYPSLRRAQELLGEVGTK